MCVCEWLLFDHFPTPLTVFDRVDHNFQAVGEVLSQQIFVQSGMIYELPVLGWYG